MTSVRLGDELIEALKAKPARIIPTTFLSIDKVAAGGFRTGDISVIAAFEGMGKSSAAEQIALGAGQALDVGVFALELGKPQTLTRLGAKLARCSEADFVRYGADFLTTEALNTRKIHVYEARNYKPVTIDQIEKAIRRDRHPLWIIDHTREIYGWVAGGPGAHAGATQMVQRFKRLAKELDIHIVLCSQLSPDGIGKPPHLWKTMDTIAPMHSSSLTLMLFRPFYRQGLTRDNVAHVIVRKNRYGPMCTLHYRWVGPTMSFWEMTPDEIKHVECCKRQQPAEVHND